MLTAAAENQIGQCHGERSGPAAINAVSCSTEARLRHNNVVSQYNEYTLVLRYNILLCPSRAEDEQHSNEAMQRMRSGTESKQQHEAHFSKCSALCSSTTVDTVSFHDIPRSTGTHHAAAHHQSEDLGRWIGKWGGDGLGMPGPNPADVPGKGEGVLPMRIRVPIEEQGLQKMLHAGEGRRNVPLGMARQHEGFLEGSQEVSQGQESAPHVGGRDGLSSAIHVEERRGSDQWDGSEAFVGRRPQPLLGEGSEEVCAGGQGGRSAKGGDEVVGLRGNAEGTSVWESRECDSGLCFDTSA